MLNLSQDSQSSHEQNVVSATRSNQRDENRRTNSVRQSQFVVVNTSAAQDQNQENGSQEPQSQPNDMIARFYPPFEQKRAQMVDTFHEHFNRFANVYNIIDLQHFPGFLYSVDRFDGEAHRQWRSANPRHFKTVIYEVDNSRPDGREVACYLTVQNPDNGVLLKAKKMS